MTDFVNNLVLGLFREPLEILKLAAACIAFGVGLYQYRSAQTWKRLEFVATQADEFFKNKSVQNVLVMLDWGGGRSVDLAHSGKPNMVIVDHEILSRALMIHSERDGFSEDEAVIRDQFDVFLARLTKLEHFIEAGLVTANDVKPYFGYWIELLSGQKEHIAKTKVLERFWEYVDYYDQKPVRRLLSRYASLPAELDKSSVSRRAKGASG